jgi:spore germination protein
MPQLESEARGILPEPGLSMHHGSMPQNRVFRSLPGKVRALLAAGLLATAAQAGAPVAPGAIVLGYLGSEAPVVLQSVRDNAGRLTAVAVGRYSLGPGGRVLGALADRDLLPFARAHHLHTYACVGNPAGGGEFDAALVHRAVGPERRAVVAALLALVRSEGYDGLNIDFEGIAPADREGFSAFIRVLAARLHRAGLDLVVSVPGKPKDDPKDPWTGAYDLRALGRAADLLQLMTYDEHEDASAPGPVAGAPWVEACVAHAASQAPPAKLLIGLPAYGYDWDLGDGSGRGPCRYVDWTAFGGWLAQPGAVEHWDAAAASPSVTFTRDGHAHEAWYETPASIRAKVEIQRRHHLAGMSVWALGQEDGAFWTAALDPR